MIIYVDGDKGGPEILWTCYIEVPLDYVPVPKRGNVTQVDPPPHAGRRIWSTDDDGRGGFLGERGGSFLGRPRRREKTEGLYFILL